MKFITYKIDEKVNIGILSHDETHVCDINELIDTSYADMNQFIAEVSESELALIRSKSSQLSEQDGIPLNKVTHLTPIPYPKRPLICLGKNYLDHVNEVKHLSGGDDHTPKFPIFFMKNATPARGPHDVIPNHSDITDKVDYEVELAVIIGKDGINIKKAEADSYIFGYTIANDVSARNIQRKHMQWFKGKSLEGFAPLGPAIVHKSAFATPLSLDIKCWVNDELRQDSNTTQMIFDIPTIIEELSKGMYLRKGDIILTGTPSGVGLGFDPFKFLKSGDQIKCQIEGIGELINTFE